MPTKKKESEQRHIGSAADYDNAKGSDFLPQLLWQSGAAAVAG